MRSKQTKEEKIVSHIFECSFSEKLNKEHTDKPDIVFETKWVEVTQVLPSLLYEISNIHKSDKTPTNKKRRVDKQIYEQDDENLYLHQKITKPLNEYTYADLKDEVEKNIKAKLDKFEDYCDNTQINDGSLVIFEKGNTDLFWVPKNSHSKTYSASFGQQTTLEEIMYGNDHARCTIDNSRMILSCDIPQLNIIFTSDFQDFIREISFFEKYSALYFIKEVGSDCFNYHSTIVNIKNGELIFYDTMYSIPNKKLNICRERTYEPHNKGEGSYILKPLVAISEEFRNKIL